jgi:hypothetical protein
MGRSLGLFCMLLAWVGLLGGCAKQAAPSDHGYAMEAEADYGGAAMSEIASTASPKSRSAAPAPPPGQAPQPMAFDPPMEAMDEGQAEVATPSTSPSSRMVHYDGSARLRVSKVQEAQDRITAIAGQLGGLVENQYGEAITIRVPVARFEEGFAQVLAVGDVLDKRISATDVTDAFFSTELRLRTARITRDRLVTLLGKAEDEQDKLFLIREISRLT